MAKSARQTALQTLRQVLGKGAYANLELEARLKSDGLDERDAALATELVYGVLRNMDLLDRILESGADRGKVNLSEALRIIGRMAVYELTFLDRIPAHAAVNEAVGLAEGFSEKGGKGFLNAVLKKLSKGVDRDAIIEKESDPEARLALKYSHPIWFVRRLIGIYGAEIAEQTLDANNRPQNLSMRVNISKIDPDELVAKMKEAGFGVVRDPEIPQSVLLAHNHRFPAEFYDQGLITPQDPAMMWATLWVGAQPGMRILDLCCGTGGKSAALAELMDNEGEIVAVDSKSHKLELLKKNADRLGLAIIRPLEADALDLPEDLGEFDAVLLDAPCTGTATFRKRPELRHRLNEEDIARMAELQTALICHAARRVKPGGALVYVTCSLMPEENENTVDALFDPRAQKSSPLLGDAPLIGDKIRFQLEDSRAVLPTLWDCNGAFAARLIREPD